MKPLTDEHKQKAFLLAVISFSGGRKRWEERSGTMMSDVELTAALRYELGTAGGSSGCADTPSIAYHSAGLKIWADWKYANPYMSEPILHGKFTLQMAREVFHILNPDNPQMSLF